MSSSSSRTGRSMAALAAVGADPSARVLLLDSALFPRDKVCSDGVAPHALDVVEKLCVDVAALVEGTDPITSLRLHSPRGVVARRDFARPARVVPRLWFDDRLLQAALAAGAQLHRHRVRRLATDGAESVVRRQVGAAAPQAGTVALAIQGYASAGAWPAAEQLLSMTKLHWPAYAWVFPVGDRTANVGYGDCCADHRRRAANSS